MNPRWIPAALVAALAMFCWSFVSHMVIGMEEKFVQPLPNDAAVMAALSASVKEKGMYVYPGEMDIEKFNARLATAPTGLLTYTPPGSTFNFGATLGCQFGLFFVCTLIAGWLYAKARPNLRTIFEQILFVALMGAAAIVLVTGGYANWYGMPWGLVAVGVLDQAVGWSLAGLVFAKMIR